MSHWFEQNADLWGEDIPWLSGLREKGRRSFAGLGLPTAKTEAWKYSFLPESAFGEPKITAEEKCSGACGCHEYDESSETAFIINFCNGKLHNLPEKLPEGLSVKPLIEAIADKEVQKYLNKSFVMENFPFAALNTAYLESGAMITVTRGVKLVQPLCFRYHTHKPDAWSSIRNIIVLESGAEATLLEDYSGEGDYFCNTVNEIYIGGEADFKHCLYVREAEAAKHISQ